MPFRNPRALVCTTVTLLLVAGSRGANRDKRQNSIADVSASNRLANTVTDLFNKGDVEGIRSLSTPEFLKGIPEAAFKGLVERVQSLGTMNQPELILDLGEQRHYKITVKREGQPDRQLLLVLGAESDKKYFSLGLEPYREPTPLTKAFATDNRQKSVLDRAVQAAVARYVGQSKPIGLSIAVFDEGKESFFNYGETATGNNVLPTSKSIYEIGSITKTMTGILLAQAVVDKKLTLDDDIRSHLPGTYPNLDFEGKKILIRHLATHTSGLPANPPGIPDDGKADAYESYSHDKLLADLASIKLVTAPGLTFGYSNMGGGLCGPILENDYATTYEKLLRKVIFGPAKMTHSGIALTPEMDKNYTAPHDARGVKTDRWIVNGIESAGAVRSDAQDMLRYARFNLNEKNPAVALSHRQLSSEGLPTMGIFWLRGESRAGGLYFSHEGGTGGFTSNILVMPQKHLAIVVLMNSGEQRAGQIGYEIALRLLKERR